jgi:hypothetical protein
MAFSNRTSDIDDGEDTPPVDNLVCGVEMAAYTRLLHDALRARNLMVGRPPSAALLQDNSPLKVDRLTSTRLAELEQAARQFVFTPDAQRGPRPYSIEPTAGIWYIIFNMYGTTMTAEDEVEEVPLMEHPLCVKMMDMLRKLKEPTSLTPNWLSFLWPDVEAANAGDEEDAPYRQFALQWGVSMEWLRAVTSPMAKKTPNREYTVGQREAKTAQRGILDLTDGLRFLMAQPSFMIMHFLAAPFLRPYAYTKLCYKRGAEDVNNMYKRLLRVMSVKLIPPFAELASFAIPAAHNHKSYRGVKVYPLHSGLFDLANFGAELMTTMKNVEHINCAFPLYGHRGDPELAALGTKIRAALNVDTRFEMMCDALSDAEELLDVMMRKNGQQQMFENAWGCIPVSGAMDRFFDPDTWRPALTDGIYSNKVPKSLREAVLTPMAQMVDREQWGKDELWKAWKGPEETWVVEAEDFKNGTGATRLSKKTLMVVQPAYDRLRRKVRSRAFSLKAIQRMRTLWGDTTSSTVFPLIESLALYTRRTPAAIKEMIAQKDPEIAHLLNDAGELITDEGNFYTSERTTAAGAVAVSIPRGFPTWFVSERFGIPTAFWMVAGKLERNLREETLPFNLTVAMSKYVDTFHEAAIAPYRAGRAPMGWRDLLKHLVESTRQAEADLTSPREPFTGGVIAGSRLNPTNRSATAEESGEEGAPTEEERRAGRAGAMQFLNELERQGFDFDQVLRPKGRVVRSLEPAKAKGPDTSNRRSQVRDDGQGRRESGSTQQTGLPTGTTTGAPSFPTGSSRFARFLATQAQIARQEEGGDEGARPDQDGRDERDRDEPAPKTPDTNRRSR